MRRLLLILVPAIALAACATGGDEPPVCDGRRLRPANPYGSVLAPTPESPTPAPIEPEKLSAVRPTQSFRSCG